MTAFKSQPARLWQQCSPHCLPAVLILFVTIATASCTVGPRDPRYKARILAGQGNYSAVAAFLNTAEYDENTRIEAVSLLGESNQMTEQLLAVSRDPSPKVRKKVAEVIARKETKKSYNILLSLSNDTNNAVRLAALKGLAKNQFCEEECLSMILGKLEDEDKSIRLFIADLITDTYPEQARKTALNVLSIARTSPYKIKAIEVLGKLKQPSDIKYLEQYTSHTNLGVQHAANQAIAGILERDATPAGSVLVQSDHFDATDTVQKSGQQYIGKVQHYGLEKTGTEKNTSPGAKSFIPSHLKADRERRIALVIGNSDYHVQPLRNPANDADLMADSLSKTGFDVYLAKNLSKEEMQKAIIEFGNTLLGSRSGSATGRSFDSTVGLFYYAGHGIQVEGKNYLVPIGAQIRSERYVGLEAFDLACVLAEFDRAGNRLNIVILDACRDNPFAGSSRSLTKGLAYVNAPHGTLIAYATAPGRTAADGEGSHGVYTQALAKQINIPGLQIEDVFKLTRLEVMNRTNKEQMPWETSSLVGHFYFLH